MVTTIHTFPIITLIMYNQNYSGSASLRKVMFIRPINIRRKVISYWYFHYLRNKVRFIELVSKVQRSNNKVRRCLRGLDRLDLRCQ